ncbi:hypothetical protein E1B28_003534 [Marasmius oreades]|uniref:ENTH domain-containing protein n=1 Tax=Marasmius oreades TaxID=181124 RepID=A0A9P7UK03_9AGAR|nr:uncharacterized protein E1B28_003534 [Marasmius oreades]KAG7086012.1 hypothetical protein E1B28_003534 [Marasmius oreades]
MQHFGKAAIRSAKNYTQGYSDVQVKVRDATSNDPWGPTGQQMNEIAKLSWNQQDFIEIIEILDKRLNDKGKNWRHVFKTLAVVDYCLLQGSEDVVRYYKENMYMIKTLREFQFVDEDGTDQGANVRQRAKDITNLLLDDSKIRAQRRGRADARDRMRQTERGNSVPWEGGGDGGGGSKRGKRSKEEEDLQRAIEESKKLVAQERETAEDRDLQRAIKLSEEDEANRSKTVEDANEKALFDDQNQLSASNASLSPQLTTNPFPMAMNTGLQSQFLQPQFTQMQPQLTSFNPFQQQMQEAAQAEYLRQQEVFQQQQQAAFQAQQQEEWMRQQMMMQQQQQQQQQFQQQQSLFPQTQSLMAQPTGFGNNNPFARNTSPGPISQQNTQPIFNIQGTYDSGNHQQTQDLSTSSSAFRTPSPNTQGQQQQGQANRPLVVKTKQNENQELANLFAERDGGQDTFGNVGLTRFGHTDAGRLVAQQTAVGNNPFARQQQQQHMNEQPFFSV